MPVIEQGLAVILDVVYNHLGPEGNYMREFAPYFTEKYRTPWGNALNFDDSWSDEVRNFFIENALYWFRNYHIDALRLDAVHAIHDMSARPFLQELSERVADFSARERKFYLIAESDQNDVRIVNPLEKGGYGIDAQWCDDLHHALHATAYWRAAAATIRTLESWRTWRRPFERDLFTRGNTPGTGRGTTVAHPSEFQAANFSSSRRTTIRWETGVREIGSPGWSPSKP